ncbi:MAG: hypothetical protein MUE69_19865 [Myxococcota bacterium]|jgi:hypothetical protein|nr:hypothetical protein [Myxococcota bacterium]
MKNVLVLLLLGWVGCGASAPSTETPGSSEATEATVRWVAESRGDDEVSGAPMTELRVEVSLDGGEPQAIAIGTLPGCAAVETGTAPMLASVHCFWAGAGDTLRVEHREGAVVVTRQGEDSQVDGAFDVQEVGRVVVGGAAVRLVE